MLLCLCLACRKHVFFLFWLCLWYTYGFSFCRSVCWDPGLPFSCSSHVSSNSGSSGSSVSLHSQSWAAKDSLSLWHHTERTVEKLFETLTLFNMSIHHCNSVQKKEKKKKHNRTVSVSGVHWLGATFWMVSQQTDIIRSTSRWRLFNLVLGAIHVFLFLNVKYGQSRYRMAGFYLVSVFVFTSSSSAHDIVGLICRGLWQNRVCLFFLRLCS